MSLINAKAKINLFFHITGKRQDRYHLLDSLIVFAQDVYDLIEINPAHANSTIVNGGEFAALLQHENNNLIDKALESFTVGTNYHCQLTKNIPIAAGLGGGSADAAMVAKFLTQEQDMDAKIKQKLSKIGADLQVCYYGRPAFVSGIGEIIQPIENFPKLYLVLVNPRKALLTKEVFKHNQSFNTAYLDNKPSNFFNDAEQVIKFLLPLTNDLTKSAIEQLPEIASILSLLAIQEGCMIARMSGSGPTCFGIFTDSQKAIEANENILKIQPGYWAQYTEI